MTETETMAGPQESFELEYRLTEADVRRYATSGKFRACSRICRDQGLGLLPLAAIGFLLVGLSYQSHGARSVGLMLAIFVAVMGGLGWLRWSRHCRQECQLAQDLGVPLDLHLLVAPRGITKTASADDSDPDRTFAWSEVVQIARVAHLTVIRLRPAGGVLLIPDRAFPDEPARGAFQGRIRAWQEAARPQPGP